MYITALFVTAKLETTHWVNSGTNSSTIQPYHGILPNNKKEKTIDTHKGWVTTELCWVGKGCMFSDSIYKITLLN